MEHCANVCKNVNTSENLFLGEGEDGDDGRIIFPEHPSPILHAPRDNISRKGSPSLRFWIEPTKATIEAWVSRSGGDPRGLFCPWPRCHGISDPNLGILHIIMPRTSWPYVWVNVIPNRSEGLPCGICCPWVRGGGDLDALGKFFCRRCRPRPQ